MHAMSHIWRVLGSHYEFFDLSKVAAEIKNLKDEERVALHTLLTKYEFLFYGNLGM